MIYIMVKTCWINSLIEKNTVVFKVLAARGARLLIPAFKVYIQTLRPKSGIAPFKHSKNSFA